MIARRLKAWYNDFKPVAWRIQSPQEAQATFGLCLSLPNLWWECDRHRHSPKVVFVLEVTMTFFRWLKFLIDAAKYRRCERQLERLRKGLD